VEAVEPNGATWRSTYDVLGRRTSVTDPFGNVVRMEWSLGGRLLATHTADGGVERWEYDGMDNVVRYTLSDGRSWRIEYGGFNKVWRAHKPDGTMFEVQYDREGRLRRVINARGEIHELITNQQGFLVEERTFDGRVSRYRYDGNGNRLRMDEPSGATVMTYDAEGQMLSREFPDGTVQTFDYDPRGDVAAARVGKSEVRYERNANGRVIREHQTLDGETHSIARQYDARGHLSHFEGSFGLRLDVRRDVMGERQQLLVDGLLLHSYKRDLRARETDVLLPGGATIQTSYDAVDRLATKRVLPNMAPDAGPEWLASRSTVEVHYEYSKTDDLISRSDKQTGTARFEHDSIGQLTKVVHDRGLVELLRYDETCNVSRGGEPATYGGGNVVQRRGDVDYVHDAEARIVEKRARGGGPTRVTRYTWSDSGLLASVATDKKRVDFDYDAFARRLGKRVYRRDDPGDPWALASKTRFVWNEALLVHEIREEARAAGDPVVRERTYVYDETSRPFAQGERGPGDTAARWLYCVCDSSGFPHHLVDAAGAVAHEIGHDALGRLDDASDADTTPLRFAGQYEDVETGLFYNRFRYYDPDLGRYVSPDPEGLARGLNAFRYAENRPNENGDPLGLSATSNVQGNLPDGTPVTATGQSGGRDPYNKSAWPSPVWNAIEKARNPPPHDAPERWDAGDCAEPNAVSNYLLKARAEAKKKGLQCTDEELLNGIKRIDTKDDDTKKGKKLCAYCRQIMGSLGLVGKCHP
jgi:RHS repeat-associated protein